MPGLKFGHGGLTIWFETKGSASNDPVVLLHGFTGTHRSWGALSDRLAKDHLLVLPDLPGHARSGAPRSKAEIGVEQTADAMAEVIRSAGRGRMAALVGYSLGGRVALDLACRHPGLLSCLVLEGASPGIADATEREERRKSDDALADDIERRGLEWFVDYWEGLPLFATHKDLPRAVVEGIRRDRLSNTARGLAMSLRAAGTGRMTPLWKKMEGIRIPVLLVAGKKDPKYSGMAREMSARIPGSAVEEVEGAGHCVHAERPKEFADIVERFLADRPFVRARSGSR